MTDDAPPSGPESSITPDKVRGRLAEDLRGAVARGEEIKLSLWARRYGLSVAEVGKVLAGVRAMAAAVAERPAEVAARTDAVAAKAPPAGPPPLPADYEILGELGRGAMGVVYRARQRSMDRVVAVKVLRPGDALFANLADRFRREVKALAKLRHPHIVAVHDVGEAGGHLFFSMDLVEGRSLHDLVQAGEVTPTRAVKLMTQVASAIAYTHSHGLVHRDLKPGNILVDGRGDAFVVDFGLARDTAVDGQLTGTGQILGTPAYMAPEQAKGDAAAIGEPSDVYALGAVLYECLTKRPPFEGRSLIDTIRAVVHDEPVAPRKLDPRIPRDLEVICQTAMAKEPQRRYPSAQALQEDLERFVEGLPIRARPASAPERLRRWAARNPAIASSVGGAFVVLVAGLAVTSYLLAQTTRERNDKAAAVVDRDKALKAERAALAETTKERDEKSAALRRSAAMSLAARSAALVGTDPGLALPLAVEAFRREPLPEARESLLAALESNCEFRRVPLGDHPFRGPLLSPDGSSVFALMCDDWRRWTTYSIRRWEVDTQTETHRVEGDYGEIAISPDGRRLAHVAKDRILVLDAKTLEERGRFPIALRAAAGKCWFGRDSRHLGVLHGADSSGLEGLVVVDTDTGEVRHRVQLKSSSTIYSVRIAGDGGSVVCFHVGELVRRASDGSELRIARGDDDRFRLKDTTFESIDDVRFDGPDARLLVESRDADGTTLMLVALDSGDVLRRFEPVPGMVSEVCWSPDGSRLVAPCEDGAGHVLDVTTGKIAGSFVFDTPPQGGWSPVGALEFSPDGRTFAVAPYPSKSARVVVNRSGIGLHDASTGAEVRRLAGTQGLAHPMFAATPGGRWLAAADDSSSEMPVWDLTRPSPVVRLRGEDTVVDGVVFSPDGSRVVTLRSDARRVEVWDAATGALVSAARLEGEVYPRWTVAGREAKVLVVGSYAFLPPGRRRTDLVSVVDGATGGVRRSFEVTEVGGKSGVLSPDETQVVVARDDGTVAAYDVATGTPALEFRGHTDAVFRVLRDSTGGRVITASADGTVRVWDSSSGACLHVLVTGVAGGGVSLSADDSTLLTGCDGSVTVWEAATGRRRGVLTVRGGRDFVTAVDPRGTRAAVAGETGGSVWDLATMQRIATLRDAPPDVTKVEFSPDGRLLLTVCGDGDAALWVATDGTLVTHLRNPHGRLAWEQSNMAPREQRGSFSPDGTRVTACSWEGAVRLFPVDPMGAARTWGARELTPVERARYLEPLEYTFAVREAARRAVERLAGECPLREEVVRRIEEGAEIDAAARPDLLAAAQELAQDLGSLSSWASGVVADPAAPQARYSLALRVAEAANAAAPAKLRPLAVVGIAQYRLGQHAAAIETLTKASVADGWKPRTSALAFLAMSQWRLGRADEARTSLGLAREASREYGDGGNADAIVSLREAEELIGK